MKLLYKLEAKILNLIPKKLRNSQLFFFGLLLLSFPVTILFAQQFDGENMQRIASESVTPITPLTSGTPTTAPIPNVAPKALSASTQYVSIQASGFLINTGANGTYSTPTTFSDVNSDPPGGGDDNRTTLELTWFESGREMRMFMYFSKNASSWKLDELRTYNGNVSGDWIYYTVQDNQGNPIQAPIDSSYTNPGITFYGTNVYGSSVSFANLNLRASLNQVTPTPEQCTPAKLTNYKLQNRCFFGGYRKVEITCSDGYTEVITRNACQSASTLYQAGIKICANRCTGGVNPEPTPVVTNTPQPTQKPTSPPRRSRGWFPF